MRPVPVRSRHRTPLLLVAAGVLATACTAGGARPLSLALAAFRGTHRDTQWNLTLAATVVVMLPVILLFLFARKSFVRGITCTGVT